MAGTRARPPAKRARGASGGLGCPAPAPGTHGRVPSAQPGFCVGREAGTTFVLGRSGDPPGGAARVPAGTRAPPAVVGAATRLGTRIQQSPQDPRPTDDCAGVHTAGKNSETPRSGAVCRLTRRGLIRVRCGLFATTLMHCTQLFQRDGEIGTKHFNKLLKLIREIFGALVPYLEPALILR